MNRSTTTLCAKCKEAGENRRLMYSELTFPRVFCEKGHEFDSCEDSESYVVTPQPEPEKPAAASPAPGKPVLELAQTMDSTPSRLPEGPEPDQEDISRGKQPVIESCETSQYAPEPEAAKPALATRPTPKILAQMGMGKFVIPPARKLAGGVLLMTVRIPDQHVSGLAAEAETQHQSVEQFLQERLEYALESRWIY